MLKLIPVINPDKSKLREAYELAEEFETYSADVPVGFQFDGASIPRAFWWLIATPFSPSVMRAALGHDWIYYSHSVKRNAADLFLKEDLMADGIPRWKANVIYWAVRLFGGRYWGNDVADLAYLDKLRERIKAEGKDPERYGL